MFDLTGRKALVTGATGGHGDTITTLEELRTKTDERYR
jgi:hypothetical protein